MSHRRLDVFLEFLRFRRGGVGEADGDVYRHAANAERLCFPDLVNARHFVIHAFAAL